MKIERAKFAEEEYASVGNINYLEFLVSFGFVNLGLMEFLMY